MIANFRFDFCIHPYSSLALLEFVPFVSAHHNFLNMFDGRWRKRSQCAAVCYVVSSAETGKTWTQFKDCMTNAVSSCRASCQKTVPAEIIEKVSTCYQQRKDGFHTKFEQCASKTSVKLDVNGPCWSKGGNKTGRLHSKENGGASKPAKTRTPDDVRAQVHDAQRCVHKCLKPLQQQCRNGCTGSPQPELHKCIKKAKTETKQPFFDCMREAFGAAATTAATAT